MGQLLVGMFLKSLTSTYEVKNKFTISPNNYIFLHKKLKFLLIMKKVIHTKTVSWNSIAALFKTDKHAHSNYQQKANVNINHGIYPIAYSQKHKGKKTLKFYRYSNLKIIKINKEEM